MTGKTCRGRGRACAVRAGLRRSGEFPTERG